LLIRREIKIDEGLARWACCPHPARFARETERQNRRVSLALKRFECIDVVAMRMGNQDMADSLTLRRLGNGFQMRLLVRARVDNGDIAPANQIGVGAFEGKG